MISTRFPRGNRSTGEPVPPGNRVHSLPAPRLEVVYGVASGSAAGPRRSAGPATGWGRSAGGGRTAFAR